MRDHFRGVPGQLISPGTPGCAEVRNRPMQGASFGRLLRRQCNDVRKYSTSHSRGACGKVFKSNVVQPHEVMKNEFSIQLFPDCHVGVGNDGRVAFVAHSPHEFGTFHTKFPELFRDNAKSFEDARQFVNHQDKFLMPGLVGVSGTFGAQLSILAD